MPISNNLNNNNNIITIQNNSKEQNSNHKDKDKLKDKYNNPLSKNLKLEEELNSNFKYFNIIWYDPDDKKEYKYLEKCFKNVEFFGESSLNYIVNYFKKESISEWIVVTHGSKGEEFINKFQNFECIKSFFIFWKDVKSHEKWAKKYKKVGCITSKAEILCQNFIKINEGYIFPNFSYRIRIKNLSEIEEEILEFLDLNKLKHFKSMKPLIMTKDKIYSINKYNKFCIKLINYLKSSEFKEYWNEILSLENSLSPNTISIKF